MKLLDEESIIYHDCDLIVSKTARRQGIGQRLVDTYDRHPNLLSNALAYAPANGRIRQRAGYQPMRALPIYIRPYGARLATDVLAKSPRLSRIVTTSPASWILRGAAFGVGVGIGVLNRLKRPRSSDEFTVEPTTSIDGDFDDLWRIVSPNSSFITVRDRKFVHWRFIEDPVFDNTVLVARDRQGAIAGYLALRVSHVRNLVVGRIMDLFCDPSSRVVVDTLVECAVLRFEARGPTECGWSKLASRTKAASLNPV